MKKNYSPLQKLLTREIDKTGVHFSDKVQVHEISKLEIDLIPELFYSKFDFRRFKSEEKFREERAVARAIRRLVGHAVSEMNVRLNSCDDVQNTERELISQSSSEPRSDLVAISSDEDTEGGEDYDDEEESDEEMHVKPLAIREEKVKARRRTSLLAVPSYTSYAYEDENIGLLDESFNFIDKNDLAFNEKPVDLNTISGLDFNGSGSSLDLTFNPVGFDTVLDEQSGRPSFTFNQ